MPAVDLCYLALILFRGDILFETVEACACTLLELFIFNIYMNNIFWQYFMVVYGCLQKSWRLWYSRFVENQNFLVKTLKNWICNKIKSLDPFWLKFWHITHNNNTKMWKMKFQKISNFVTPNEENLRFSQFWTKISRSRFHVFSNYLFSKSPSS